MKYFDIKNFKCFRSVRIPFNGLTVLAGANGNGKSSVIQALLLFRSSIERCAQFDAKKNIYQVLKSEDFTAVELNGKYNLNLGYGNCIIPRNSSKSIVEFKLAENTTAAEIKYEVTDEDLYITPVFFECNKRPLFLFQQEFYYLNAERLGPRVKQEIKHADFPNTGSQGEYTAHLLGNTNFNYSFKVEDIRKYPEVNSPRLEQQTNAWLNDLMPGVNISSSYDSETMSARISMNNPYTQGVSVAAPNIGFGISYVLPIIVSGLIAKKGAILIVENPEAHLHPSAQSKIGRFLAMLAQAGVNVIVETHSDHVLNGIQIACAKQEIDPSLVSVNFFSYSKEQDQPLVESISINPKGELSAWPQGFFDQSQSDFAQLFKLRKP